MTRLYLSPGKEVAYCHLLDNLWHRQFLIIQTRFLPSTLFNTFSVSDYDREFLLLVLFLGVVSPDAVVKRGEKAQPGHIGHHEQKRSATDGIPRNHGGYNGPSDEDNIKECLYWAKTGCYMDKHLLHHPQPFKCINEVPILVCVHGRREQARPS